MADGAGTDSKRIWMWVGIAAAVVVALGLAWFFLAGDQAQVPNVAGMKSADAVRALENAGFKLGTTTQSKDSTMVPGSVISQIPAGGTKAKKGTAVDLTVAAAPALIPVPDVKSREASAAAEEIKAAGLVAAPYSDYSTASPAGTVFGQIPLAGEQVAPGTTIALGISLGAQPVSPTVPKVIGKTTDEANASLKSAGFSSQLYEGYSDTVAQGLVITQFPTAGTKALAGSAVAIQVSKGKSPQPTSNTVSVPNVVGKTQATAETTIKNAGLAVESYNVFNDTVPKGNVIGQLPAAGSKVDKGTVIGLAISDGKSPQTVTVPNLIGKTSAEATAALKAIGLKPVAQPKYDAEQTPGTVIAQLPAAGSQVPPNSQVALQIAEGPKPTPY
jgi:eukaryotic-like serine/threonine-protein kinase